VRVVSLIILLAGCARTEIMIGLITDIHAPETLNRVEMDVARDGVVIIHYPWDVPGIAGQDFALPGSFGINSSDGSASQVEITVGGFKNGTQIVERHATVSLVSGKTLFMRMALVVSCISRSDCAADQTCVEGTCVSRMIDEKTLPDFRAERVTTVECASGSTFVDTASGQPVPMASDATPCPSGKCHEGTCYQPPPSSSGGTRGDICSQSGSCSKGGSFQACACGDGSCAYYLASDGQRFNCASSSDCNAAANAVAQWCASH
jgi:hypothetical protein